MNFISQEKHKYKYKKTTSNPSYFSYVKFHEFIIKIPLKLIIFYRDGTKLDFQIYEFEISKFLKLKVFKIQNNFIPFPSFFKK